MVTVTLTALSKSRAIQISLKEKGKIIGQDFAPQAEAVFTTLDTLLRDAKIKPTEIDKLKVSCHRQASHTSCRISKVIEASFRFAKKQLELNSLDDES